MVLELVTDVFRRGRAQQLQQTRDQHLQVCEEGGMTGGDVAG